MTTQATFVPNYTTEEASSTDAGLAFSHVHMGLHQYNITTAQMTFALMMRQMVLKLVGEAHKPKVGDKNYALSVLQAFIVISLMPLLASTGALSQQTEQNASFQQSMSQFQSFFNYIESITAPPNSKDPNYLPNGWNTSTVGQQKLQSLYAQFYSMFYEGGSTNPTWSQMFFMVRDPSSPTGFTKVPFIDPKTGQLQPNIQKILVAFNLYFASSSSTQPPIIDPNHINGSSHIPDVLMLLFTSMQSKMDNTFVPLDSTGAYDFATAYGLSSTPGGAINPSSFGSLDSTLAAANSFWILLEQPETGPINPDGGGNVGSELYAAAYEQATDPTNHQARTDFETITLENLALQFQNGSNDPGSSSGLLPQLEANAGMGQQEANTEGQDLITALQTIGQTMSTEVQTGQGIASNEAASEEEMVADQTPV